VVHDLIFGLLATLGVIGALGLILQRTPVYAILFAILNFFALAGFFLLLQAEFLAVIQIIVYAGAIMVLFLFVVMLLNLDKDSADEVKFDWRKGAAFILGLAFVGQMGYAFTGLRGSKIVAPEQFGFGKVEAVGNQMMTQYLFPFEMISVILLAALLGALVIARKHN
jgi:NADH-quinone oxidoreductase subunit J